MDWFPHRGHASWRRSEVTAQQIVHLLIAFGSSTTLHFQRTSGLIMVQIAGSPRLNLFEALTGSLLAHGIQQSRHHLSFLRVTVGLAHWVAAPDLRLLPPSQRHTSDFAHPSMLLWMQSPRENIHDDDQGTKEGEQGAPGQPLGLPCFIDDFP